MVCERGLASWGTRRYHFNWRDGQLPEPLLEGYYTGNTSKMPSTTTGLDLSRALTVMSNGEQST